ncbi:uncharacterized protein LOC110447429 isoform X2 [Mizuhopecten yessoensis]|uniref:uncharacterized protein LOC110447429 isoform X2 n=1 Tax=Mizuhopecten yessoensis TaxID=6573 RepID=UPI000B45A902|nr:uncharacterized protein LOC110447429 isoform X2 [Mizuhopecten yessoensis]XP_021348794.1 uncharacterized protein LOC110447429 isoform X2 [Mizuhopecten yessoensis]XP_021348795.1 uncharacterized protein LOC110447429 isoform X2 [Mizuhopecten yessoensis]
MVSFVRIQFPEVKMENVADEDSSCFHRRQAVRRKGFVFQRVQTLSKIVEGKRASSISALNTTPSRGRLKTQHPGSSLDLAPSLLSIYDSIALASKTSQDVGDKSHDQATSPSTNQNKLSDSHSSNQVVPPLIKLDCGDTICDVNGSHGDVARHNNDLNDSKKRPLSISSMSSSSSSSLPRHTRKRPNLCEFDPVALGRGDMEKLDQLMYIDDDVPNGAAEDDMLVDTDSESSKRYDNSSAIFHSSASVKSSASVQSSVSAQSSTSALSSASTVSSASAQSNTSHSSETNDHENHKRGLGAKEKESVGSTTGHTDSFHNNQIKDNTNASSPLHGVLNTSNSTSVTSPASPVTPGVGASPGVGISPGVTPRSSNSFVRRDSTSPSKYVTYVQRVVAEIVETERIYVRYLKEIIYGYLEFLKNSTQTKVSEKERSCLFGNILEIYEFSRGFLGELELCEDNPLKVADCFVRHNEGFAIYAHYCTNYPSAVEVLTRVMLDPELCELVKKQQQRLGHNLPLGSYLLKPVQRVLKYHLLLHNILKNYDKKDPGHKVLTTALDHMTGMAQHINEMKRKHEHAVRVQEIQSQLEEYEGEDLTRIGELVLEGSFRMHGAKTSRHVFLFEKGILIAKKREDSMLSSKGVILCSNLMLVESLPKEPLSFQIIPFDNPRGQHTLQARNLDQKHKWCQEIKRHIIESYKDKIPEKAKGLVMQLGKSREEESVSPADHGAKKTHHHNAPEYLERRHRMRRKSGTIISELLKPHYRKDNRRAESVSPRVSPNVQRKYSLLTTSEMSLTPNAKGQDEAGYSSSGDINSSISRDTTASDLSTLTSDGDLSLPGDDPSDGNALGRNRSFKSAMRGCPLLSTSIDMEEDVCEKEISKTKEDTVTKRSRSFRIATRMKPLRSVDFSDERLSVSGPNTPIKDKVMNEFGTTMKEEPGSRININSRPCLKSYHSDTYSSMPVLSEGTGGLEGHHSSGKHGSDFKRSSTHSSDMEGFTTPRSSVERSLAYTSDSFSALLPQPKRVIDIKRYFTVNREQNARTKEGSNESLSNLRRDGKSVSAFNDTFLKKATHDLLNNSAQSGTKSVFLTRPLPLAATLTSDQRMCSSSCSNVGIVGNRGSSFKDENPWVQSNTDVSLLDNKPLRQRAHSTDGELDSLDWMVYANRNDLPVTGFSTDDIPKLCKGNSSHERLDNSSTEDVFSGCSNIYSNRYNNQQYQSSCHCDLISADKKSQEPDLSSEAVDQNRDLGKYGHLQHFSPYDRDGDDYNTLGKLPQIHKHRPLKRSNSTPSARVGVAKNENLKGARSSSFDMDQVIFDHEKIVAEMEEYLKKSDSTLSLEAQKFPTNINQMSPDNEVTNHLSHRDSCASNISSSSYESQESDENIHNDSIVDTLKNKIHDFASKITHRRSGSYDNKLCETYDQDNDLASEKHSPLSVNSWFTSSRSQEPDLASVLQSGELGGAVIGQRMAECDIPQNPDYNFSEPTLSLKQSSSKEKLQPDCSFNDDNFLDADKMTSEMSKDNATILNLQNLNIQQCDSAFSIGDSCNTENSPRSAEEGTKLRRNSDSDSSGDSFYERRLSIAFDEGDAFRDSAVYCEMDVDPVDHADKQSTVSSMSPLSLVSKPMAELPIKAYVQRLEEKVQPKLEVNSILEANTQQPLSISVGNKAAAGIGKAPREPGVVVRQRMESLQQDVIYRSSRPSSEERDVRVYSKSTGDERELSPFAGRFRLKRASTPCRGEDDYFLRESSDPAHVFRSRSSTPGSGVLKPSRSLGRLDQLSSDPENLVIMKGWVRQLIQKFQSTKS